MPAGRPSSYSPEIGDTICERLMGGESLRGICRDDDMPDRNTVLRWMRADAEFAAKCAHARLEQADLMDERILEVADRVERGDLDPHAAKVVISALQWRASKLKPKVYGDKVQTELTGKDGEPLIPPPSENEVARRVAYILHKQLKAQGVKGATDGPA